jgi:hypothetical protein
VADQEADTDGGGVVFEIVTAAIMRSAMFPGYNAVLPVKSQPTFRKNIC